MTTYTSTHWPAIGHDWAVQQMTRALNAGRDRHAYLLTGPPSIGKTTLARSMAMALNCEADAGRPCGQCRTCTLIAQDKHPDITLLEAERVGGTLKIDAIRELQRSLARRPYEARQRVAIIRRFHEAGAAGANALLKTLEEPPGGAVLILTAEDAQSLLPTIFSRCQHYALLPIAQTQLIKTLQTHWQASESNAALLARLSGGRLGWAVRVMQDDSHFDDRQAQIDLLETLLGQPYRERFKRAEKMAKDKQALPEMLHHWQSYWRDALLLAYDVRDWVTNIDHIAALDNLTEHVPPEALETALMATRRTLGYLAHNVNTRLAVDTLMLDYPVVSDLAE